MRKYSSQYSPKSEMRPLTVRRVSRARRLRTPPRLSEDRGSGSLAVPGLGLHYYLVELVLAYDAGLDVGDDAGGIDDDERRNRLDAKRSRHVIALVEHRR